MEHLLTQKTSRDPYQNQINSKILVESQKQKNMKIKKAMFSFVPHCCGEQKNLDEIGELISINSKRFAAIS